MRYIFGKILLLGTLAINGMADYYEDGSIAYEKKDYKKAWNLMNKSCDNGYSSGCGMIGAYYEDGIVVTRNYYKALEYYDKACGMGHNWFCEHLSKLKKRMPVCSENEISFINDKRYFGVASADSFPLILADAKTIQIDKKNKTIKVWTAWIVSEAERQHRGNILGKYDNYDNYGYDKKLDTINYGSMKVKLNSSTNYNCDGSNISSINTSEWNDIVPDSVMEMITESIMKKYKLK